jgi:hypothetical protein
MTVLVAATRPSNLKRWGAKRSRNPTPIQITPTAALTQIAALTQRVVFLLIALSLSALDN